ncbi:MAG: hypothetical protein FWD78_07310 [Treponema sp.]|nr:hypothetical protein [Treponema sp.]
MKRYGIKSQAGKIEYFDILSEDNDGYRVRLTRIIDGSEKITEIGIPRHLFNLCLRTGYISELNFAA